MFTHVCAGWVRRLSLPWQNEKLICFSPRHRENARLSGFMRHSLGDRRTPFSKDILERGHSPAHVFSLPVGFLEVKWLVIPFTPKAEPCDSCQDWVLLVGGIFFFSPS